MTSFRIPCGFPFFDFQQLKAWHSLHLRTARCVAPPDSATISTLCETDKPTPQPIANFSLQVAALLQNTHERFSNTSVNVSYTFGNINYTGRKNSSNSISFGENSKSLNGPFIVVVIRGNPVWNTKNFAAACHCMLLVGVIFGCFNTHATPRLSVSWLCQTWVYIFRICQNWVHILTNSYEINMLDL